MNWSQCFCFWWKKSWLMSCLFTARKVSVFGVFWSVFSSIWTGYREIQSMHPYSVGMREYTDQKISEYGHFSSSGSWTKFVLEQKIALFCFSCKSTEYGTAIFVSWLEIHEAVPEAVVRGFKHDLFLLH